MNHKPNPHIVIAVELTEDEDFVAFQALRGMTCSEFAQALETIIAYCHHEADANGVTLRPHGNIERTGLQ